MPQRLDDLVRLTDRHWWMTFPHDVFTRLRNEQPVFWSERDGQFAITKYEDVRYISSNPEIFPSSYGHSARDALADLSPDPMIRACARRDMNDARHGGENLVAADPPRHTFLRQMLSFAFTPKAIAQLELQVNELAETLVGGIVANEELDFVEQVAAPVPTLIIAKMLGVPAEDVASFRKWSDTFIEMSSATDVDEELSRSYAQELADFNDYFRRELVGRHKNPRDDLLSALAHSGDGSFDIDDQLASVKVLLIAGNETTRGLISGAVKLLCEHPNQRALLVEDLSLMTNAIEESLRYITPVTHFSRTAINDTVIRDTPIARGHYVTMIYVAANRDEDIWERPQEFDITRRVDPTHLSFGFGEHFCLGAALARREARIVLSKLLQRFPEIELTEEIERFSSYGVPGIKKMPVAFIDRVSA